MSLGCAELAVVVVTSSSCPKYLYLLVQVKRVLKLLETPYSDGPEMSPNKINLFCNPGPSSVAYDSRAPHGFQNIRLS